MRKFAKGSVVGLEWPRDEGNVFARQIVGDGFVLPSAVEIKLGDTVVDTFDVAKHHGRGGFHA